MDIIDKRFNDWVKKYWVNDYIYTLIKPLDELKRIYYGDSKKSKQFDIYYRDLCDIHGDTDLLRDKYLHSVSRIITKHPEFYWDWNFFTNVMKGFRYSKESYDPMMYLTLLPRGKGYILQNEIVPLECLDNDHAVPGKSYMEARVNVTDSGDYETVFSRGEIYKLEDYFYYLKTENKNTSLIAKLSMFDPKTTPTIIVVKHKYSRYLSNGIEVAEASYKNIYPSTGNITNNRKFKSTVKISEPKWITNGTPKSSITGLELNVSNASRDVNSLGLVRVSTFYGNEGKGTYSIHAAATRYSYDESCWNGPSHPEYISYTKEPIKIYLDSGVEYISEKYQNKYPNMSFTDIKKEVMKEFYLNLDYVIDYKKVVDRIANLTRESLIEKYEVDINELDSKRKK